jgi:hypothetical protein
MFYGVKYKKITIFIFSKQNTQHWISIDSEDYELKPIHATLLPKKVYVFYNPAASLS